MLVPAACFAAGIVAAESRRATLGDTISTVPWLIAAAGACMLAGLLLARARHETLSGVLALFAFALSGTVAAKAFEFRFTPLHVSHLEDMGIDLEGPLRLSGRIVSAPIAAPSGIQFDLELTGVDDRGRFRPLEGKVRLRMRRAKDPPSADIADSLGLRYGDSIRALAELHKPRVYRDPGVFNFRRWMESVEDIYWQGTIKSPLLVEKLPQTSAPSPSVLIVRVRHRLLAGIDQIFPPWSVEGRDGAVLKAVLLGDRSSLDSETLENFRQSGLYHLLVISGLHVGLLVMLVAFLLRSTPLGDTWRAALVMLFLFGYCSLVEQRAPTLRAAIMITAYLVARFFYREHAGLNAVGLAALVLLVHRPPWLFESGFQLSFAAALLIVGLVAPILGTTTELYRQALRDLRDTMLDVRLAPPQVQFRLDVRRVVERVEGRFSYLKKHPRAATWAVTLPLKALVWTANILFFSSILQIGLTLPMAETFHRVTYVGIGLNALAIPLMTVLLGLALPTVLLSAVSPAVAVWPAKLVALVMEMFFWLTDWPYLPHWLSYRVPSPAAWVAWGFAVSVVVVAWALGRRRLVFWLSTISAAIFAILISLNPFPPRIPSGLLEITALDCGEGAASFLVLPDRTTMLVGACGIGARASTLDPFAPRRWDAGEEIVSPYLWSRGIKKIGIVVLDDGNEGRLSSFAAITRNFEVGEIWHASAGLAPATLAFLDELQRRGIAPRAVAAGDRFLFGETSIQILTSQAEHDPAAGPTSRTSNRPTIAMRISAGEASALLYGGTGDQIENTSFEPDQPLEDRLLVFSEEAALSRLTPDLLARIRLRVVVLSGMRADDGGFSQAELRARLAAAGVRLLRTSLEGAVTIEMKQAAISVHTYRMLAGEGTFESTATGDGDPSSSSVR